MKILLDTNVLISAFIFGGKSGSLLSKLFDSEHEIYVSEYVDQEFKSCDPSLNGDVYNFWQPVALRFD